MESPKEPIVIPIAFDGLSDEEQPTQIVSLPVPKACVTDSVMNSTSSIIQSEFYPVNHYDNMNGRHGQMFEHAGHFEDLMAGKDTVILGGNNRRSGPDRSVDGVHLQAKVMSNAAATVRSMFDKSNDLRYKNSDGTPMVFEVAKDQYERIIAILAKRKADGCEALKEVGNVETLVRRGAYTRAECINMCKAGTFPGFVYDIRTGAIPACFSGVLTLWVEMNDERKEPNWSEAVCTSMKTSLFHMVTHITTCQMGRMGVVKLLRTPVEAILRCAPKDLIHSIVNLGRAKPIYGAAARSFASKMVRFNLVSNAVVWVGYSTMNTVQYAQNKMTGDEYACALLQTGGSLAAGTVGAQAGAIVGSFVLGPIGGFIGGTIGSIAAAVIANDATSIVYNKFRPIQKDEEEKE